MKKYLKHVLAFVIAFVMLLPLLPERNIQAEGDVTEEPIQEVTTPEPEVQEVEEAPIPEATPAPAPAPEPTPSPVVEEAPVQEEVVEEAPVEVDGEPVEEVKEEEKEETPAEEVIPEEKQEEEVTPEETPAEKEEVPEEKAEEDAEKEEAPAEEEENAEKAEVKYPAIALSKTVGSVKVTVSAPEGSVPEGTSLSVKQITAQKYIDAVGETVENEGKTLSDAIAFDVTLIGPNGEEVQPKIPVTVSFSGTSLDVEKGDEISVYRVSDDASTVTEVPVTSASSNFQQFTADHFTIYVAGGSTSDPNGDGSGPNTYDNPYVLEYGQSITLNSNNYSILGNNWDVSDGAQYISRTGSTIRNTNTSSDEHIIAVEHFWLVGLRRNFEYFYIKVLPQTFKVTFMVQDVGEAEFTQVHESIVNRGTDVTDAPTYADKEEGGKSYKFYGWSSNEDLDDTVELTNITSDMTVYGKYTTEAKIHYVKNTTDAATVPADTVGGVGNLVTIGSDATRAGHSLYDWNTSADGSGTRYQPGEEIHMPENGLTLYAQWDEDKIVMRYYRNYNVFDFNIFRSVSNIPRNDSTTLLKDVPERPGFVFRGWGLANTAATPSYYPGQSYDTSYANDTINLYAVWGEVRLQDMDIQSLTAKGEEIVYDGQVHTIEGVEEPEDSRFPGYVKVGTYYFSPLEIISDEVFADVRDIRAERKDVGSDSTPLSAPLYRRSTLGIMVPLNQFIPVTNTVLRVTPVELTVNTDSAEKVKDGNALTAGGKLTYDGGEETFTYDGSQVTLIAGEKLNIRTTGSQTEIGESDNTFEVDWGKPEWSEVSTTARKYNYRINIESHGRLHVHGVTKVDAKDPTCEEDGNIEYWICDDGDTACNKIYSDEQCTTEITLEDTVIPALGHDWGEPVYEWAPDNSEVRARRYCSRDESHYQQELVLTTEEITKEATCDEMGETTYTATFESEIFETQTKTVENIDALGHDWGEPVYEWAPDNSEVRARRYCSRDENHYEQELVLTTEEITKPATCEEMGETTYTATFDYEIFETQTKTVVNIDALGHDFGEWEVVKEPTTTEPGLRRRVCKNDPEHIEEEEIPALEPVLYELTFDPNGGTIDGSADPVVFIYEENEEITIIDAPVREGYKFLYWEGSEYQPGDTYQVVENHTFTAKWEKVVKPTPEKKEEGKASPNTRDAFDLNTWYGLFAMALLSFALTLKLRKRIG